MCRMPHIMIHRMSCIMSRHAMSCQARYYCTCLPAYATYHIIVQDVLARVYLEKDAGDEAVEAAKAVRVWD